MCYPKALCCFGSDCFAVCRLAIRQIYNLATGSLLISGRSGIVNGPATFCSAIGFYVGKLACFTMRLIPVSAVFVKVRQRLNFLAERTGLCYNSGVHNQFLNNWLWLLPFAVTSAGGIFSTLPRTCPLINFKMRIFWRNI